MTISPYVFKARAARALKGNWQTALLVSFFASLPLTLVQVLESVRLPDLTLMTSVEAMLAAVNAVPQSTWTLMSVLGLLAFVLTPVLALGCNLYFIRRLHGEELGFKGLFARMSSFGKALWLYVLMYVKIGLWSLLLVVPGVLAALRYSMAPFFLAEDPTLTAGQALEKSKEAMKERKMSYFLLQLSFVGWLVMAMLTEMLLYDISPIIALVASQFIQLYMAAYLNGACAAFYGLAKGETTEAGMAEELNRWMQQMRGETPPSGDDDRFGAWRPQGRQEDEAEEDETNDEEPAEEPEEDDGTQQEPAGGQSGDAPQEDGAEEPQQAH